MTTNTNNFRHTSPLRVLILLAVVYIAGNLSVFLFFYYFANINLDQALRIPALFIAVPIVGFLIAIIGDLFKTTGRLKIATLSILGLYVITWLLITVAWINILFDGIFWNG